MSGRKASGRKVRLVQYPEHEKLRLVSEKSQACGEFLDWLIERGWEPREGGSANVRKLLAEFFEIDQELLEREKEHMLEGCRLLGDAP